MRISRKICEYLSSNFTEIFFAVRFKVSKSFDEIFIASLKSEYFTGKNLATVGCSYSVLPQHGRPRDRSGSYPVRERWRSHGRKVEISVAQVNDPWQSCNNSDHLAAFAIFYTIITEILTFAIKNYNFFFHRGNVTQMKCSITLAPNPPTR